MTISILIEKITEIFRCMLERKVGKLGKYHDSMFDNRFRHISFSLCHHSPRAGYTSQQRFLIMLHRRLTRGSQFRKCEIWDIAADMRRSLFPDPNTCTDLSPAWFILCIAPPSVRFLNDCTAVLSGLYPYKLIAMKNGMECASVGL